MAGAELTGEPGQKQTAPPQATPGAALRRHRVILEHQNVGILTIQAFPGRVHIREIITRASTNHQVKGTPLFNLGEKNSLRGREAVRMEGLTAWVTSNLSRRDT